jgi:serine/threonine protein kinase
MNIGTGLTVNPSATNLANMTSNNFRAFVDKEKKHFPHKNHVLSNEQCASSSALSHVPKTPPNMERNNRLGQRGNSIKCLEVLSKKIASQTRQSKTRKGSRMNKTYDLRSPNSYKRRMSPEEIENDNLIQKMEAVRKDKRNRYEAAVCEKLKEQELENTWISEKDRHKEEIRRMAARRDDNMSEDDNSCATTTNLEDFVIGKVIGQGAYAVVRIGLHKPTDKWVAIKIYEKSKLVEPQRRKSVKREIKLMERMSHPNICSLFDVLETSTQLFIIMEFVGGGSLHSYLKSHANRRLPENEARRIFRQMLGALKYCHSLCITHRDIKLENILLDDNLNVKIIDFGFSTRIPNDRKVKLFWGTPSYMAPEIVTKTEYCGPPADIWAMGVLLYALLHGSFPYRGATDKELYTRICSCEWFLGEHLSRESKELFYKIFTYESDRRPSADSLYYEAWVAPPLSMKDKVASILGESKSTYASSMNKISNSNNEESGSDNKPRFYRKEMKPSETDLQALQIQDKRIGNKFRIVRSPGT